MFYVDLYTKGKTKLRIIQAYIPPNNTDNKDEIVVINKFISDTITDANRNNMKLFVMGDLNCYSDKWMHYVDNGLTVPPQFRIFESLASVNMIDSLSAFHDDYLTADRLHTYAHLTNNVSSRIDYHWLSP